MNHTLHRGIMRQIGFFQEYCPSWWSRCCAKHPLLRCYCCQAGFSDPSQERLRFELWVLFKLVYPILGSSHGKWNLGSTSCNNITGRLPPISDDCETIEASIQIFASDITSSTFTTQPNHQTSLTFGTCGYFFQNLGKTALVECWADFVSNLISNWLFYNLPTFIC